ncbi:hypothetical protein ABT071_13770 [Streptomyces sp. NPDC002506]|uniref:hypothetical protein n=1 Tax=Streptomyces sp. NPDC002506 TaxID=3154536 RepID=UPI0033190034
MPDLPEVDVIVTRYEVSLLPLGDINRKFFVLYVERLRRAWVVHDGHGGYGLLGDWTSGIDSGANFADYDDALDLARRLAPGVTVNGRTAADAWRRTHRPA